MEAVDCRPVRLEPDRDQLELFMDCLLHHRGHGGYLSLRAFTHSDKLLSRVRFTSVTKGLGHLCHVGIAGSVV